MKELIKEKYKNGFICYDSACFKSLLYGKLNSEIKEIVSSALKSNDNNLSKIYNDCVETMIYPFVSRSFEKAEQERKLDEPVQLEEVSPLEKTAFMPTFNTFSESDFSNDNNIDNNTFDTKVSSFEDYKNDKEVEETEEDSKTFIIDFDKLNSKNEDLNTNHIENTLSSSNVEEESAVNEIETQEELEEKPKTKVKSIFGKKEKKTKELKKTGYVDTVILCLVAQLTIFGILILVLLIIK